jgi:hypothetical protein
VSLPTTTNIYTRVYTEAVTRDIIIDTPAQLATEAAITEEHAIGKHTSRVLEWVILLFDWASHRLTKGVSYKTPIFLSVNDNLFHAFKAIVREISSDEEERRDSYPEKGNRFFLKEKCMVSCTKMAVQV